MYISFLVKALRFVLQAKGPRKSLRFIIYNKTLSIIYWVSVTMTTATIFILSSALVGSVYNVLLYL